MQTGDEIDYVAQRAKRDKLVYLVLFLIGVAALWIFVEVADEIEEGEGLMIDERLTLALREPHDPAELVGPPWVDEAVRDITALGSMIVLTLVTAGALVYLLLIRQWTSAIITVVSVGGGTVLSQLLKDFYARERPDIVPHAMEVFTASFPSGHSTLSAVTYLTLGALLTQAQTRRSLKAYIIGVAILLTVLVGVSRVWLGVHYPSDVLAGWSLGAAWALGWWLAALELRYHLRRRHYKMADEPAQSRQTMAEEGGE